ncbi:MAG: AarF/UbiB family protein, partial [Myxococcota bacterium]
DAVGASEEERAAWVRTMWRFVFKGTLVGGMFNADPHPGNFIFGPDGTVYFLDFGCIQPLEPDRMRHARRMHWSAIQEDSNEFIAAVRDLMDLRGGHYEEQALGYVSKAFAPLFESPFHMSRDYVVGLVQGMKEIAVAARKAKGSDNFVPMPRGMFFMNRLQFGFYSVVARMDVPVDYRKVELEFLAPLMA